MKRFLLILILSLLFTMPAADAAQSPTLGVTFSCTPGGAACTEFLRLTSDALGWNAGLGVARMQFVQSETLRRLHRLARDKAKEEAGNTAINNAETTFNSSYIVP
jgi:hypothetical protein